VPHVGPSLDDYHKFHADTVGGPEGSDEWWRVKAKETLYWHRPFETVRSGGFEHGDIQWFVEGGLNASYNAVDRYVILLFGSFLLAWSTATPRARSGRREGSERGDRPASGRIS
jgi:hypothetical protein